jgi:hypothetical protein
MKLHFGNKERDPIALTSFYRSDEPDTKFNVDTAKISYCIPTNFMERVVRVYSRGRDIEHVRAVSKAFRKLLRTRVANAATVSDEPANQSRVYASPAHPSSSSSASLASFGGHGSATTDKDGLSARIASHVLFQPSIPEVDEDGRGGRDGILRLSDQEDDDVEEEEEDGDGGRRRVRGARTSNTGGAWPRRNPLLAVASITPPSLSQASAGSKRSERPDPMPPKAKDPFTLAKRARKGSAQ